MDAVNEHLYSRFGLHLLWPTYGTPDDEVGYLTRVYKGVKENGAIFSHPNPWAVIAECMLGRGERAMKFHDALNPASQNDLIEIRESEPYAYCQFIMGRDHSAHGRARHPWLTGTAAWAYSAITRRILGIRPTWDGLVVDPCIPPDWGGFRVERNWRGALFRIEVRNPEHVSMGILSMTLNGEVVEGPLPIQEAGSACDVVVIMGALTPRA